MAARDDATLLDIVNAARLVVEWTSGLAKDAFLADRRTQSAVERQLEILGEATKRLSMDFREQHPHIPWRQIAGLRDVLIHRYDDVNLDILWETVAVAVPSLLTALEEFLPPPPVIDEG
jgi:uncharacterized protein with HEPN domain